MELSKVMGVNVLVGFNGIPKIDFASKFWVLTNG